MNKKKLYKISSSDLKRQNIKIGSSKEIYDFYNECGTYEKNSILYSRVPAYMILEKKEDGFHEYLTDLLVVKMEDLSKALQVFIIQMKLKSQD